MGRSTRKKAVEILNKELGMYIWGMLPMWNMPFDQHWHAMEISDLMNSGVLTHEAPPDLRTEVLNNLNIIR